jgi:predicted acylesterase/phospholipase RssA
MISDEILQPLPMPMRGPISSHDPKEKRLRRLGRVQIPDFSQYAMYLWVLLSAVLILANTQGCASVPKRNPVPEEFSKSAEIPDIPRARIWGDEPPPWEAAWLAMSPAELQAQYSGIIGRKHYYLAISGGGPKGAFGAGLLVGWTAVGTRPQFTMVTGISTGALSAPFAFLGPAYDDKLREIYTSYSTEDLLKRRSIFALLSSDAGASTEPLRAKIAEYFDQEVIDAIAAEHRKGRRLLIGTTNLDADRPVIWNIGSIAASGAPDSLKLVHDVLLASASIPGAFPPVIIEVEADGLRYDEMHVDGGTTTQVFLYPLGMDWDRLTEKLNVKGTPSVYVIRNARLVSEWEAVERRVMPIAGRSISSLIRTQGIGDMYRIYLGAQRDGLDYNLAHIPEEFEEKSKEPFDPEYMRKLFDLGYRLAKNGYPWKKIPPGLE